MRPETLQSLSVGIVFIGLALVALGGLGTFHFGRQLDRTEEQRRTALAQSFVDTVRTLREDQQRVLDRVAVVEERAMAPALSLPPAVSSSNPAPPPAQFLIPNLLPVSTSSVPEPPKILQLPLPSSAPPNPLLPHLPAIAQGPADGDEIPPTPPPAILTPPRLMLPPARLPVPTPLPVMSVPQIAASLPSPSPVTVPLALTPPAPVVTVVPGSSSRPSGTATETEVFGDRDLLSGEKRGQLIKRLRRHSRHEIVIRASAGNALAVKLAILLRSTFREAGWVVGEIEMVHLHLPPHALLLSSGAFPPPPEFVAAYASLAATGFLVTSDLDPNQGSRTVVMSVGPIP